MKKLNHLRFILLPALFALLIITYSCKENVTTPSENTSSFAGQIVDEQDIPVPGAIVQVYTASGIQGLIDKDTTDEDGNFQLAGVPQDASKLKMRIDHVDFASFDLPFADVTKGKDNKKLGVKLQHDSACTGILQFSTVDNNNNPVGNVEIRLNRNGQIIRKAKTNEYGSLVYDNVCAGEYWVRIAKEGFKVIEQSFKINEKDTLQYNIKLLGNDQDTCCNGVITFNAKDSADNSAIAGATVRLWKGSQKIKEVATNADGSVKFEKICEGEYQISFFKEGFTGVEFTFTMGCNDTADFNKIMAKKTCCNGVIQLTMLDSATNSPISNLKANLWQDGKLLRDSRSNDQGIIIFTGVCEGKYGFSFQSEKYKNIEFNVEIGCNDTILLTKKMLLIPVDTCCNGSITLNLIDKATKDKINGATVKLWKGGTLLTKKVSEAGAVKFEKLCEGEYILDIIHEKYKAIESIKITLGCNQQVGNSQELEAKDSCCNGVIIAEPRDFDNKMLVSGTKVQLYLGDKIVYQETVHDSPLKIGGLCEGDYQIKFTAEGYNGGTEVLHITCNDTISHPFYLKKIDKDSCCHGSVTITPKDSATGQVIKGATVKLWKGSQLLGTKTVEGDNVVFDGLCEGKYSFSILDEHHKSTELGFELGCNEHKSFEKIMVSNSQPCCNGKFIITVKDDESGEPLNGALVKISQGGKLLTYKYVENGSVTFEKLCEGTYGFNINKDGYTGTEFSAELGCDETKTIDKTIKKKACCDGFIIVTVKDSSENVLAGVTTSLWSGGTKVGIGTTNEEGVYIFSKVCEGNYQVSMSKTGFKSKEAQVEIGCHDTVYASYNLLKAESVDTCNTAEIELIVREKESDKTLPGATVKVYDISGHVIAEGVTDDNGHFVKSDLKAPGKYKFWSSADGYNDGYIVVEWAKCERKEAVLPLQKK